VKVPFEEGKELFSFSEQDGKGKLLGGRCKNCGDYSFPPRRVCKKCFREEVEKVELGGKGIIHSSAVIINAPLRFQAPYAVAYVDLAEGPRLFAQLTTCNPEEIKFGTKVEMVVGPLRHDEQGNEIVGYKFQPVK
jgi:hypothetical protein